MSKQFVFDQVNQLEALCAETCRWLWDNPEVGGQEKQSADHMRNILSKEGFVIVNEEKMEHAFYAEYGSGKMGGWILNTISDPWKIQCPTCMRRFPSNDFGEFYKTGLDEHGFWHYEQAKANGSHLLVNTEYPEKDEHIDKNGVLQNEGVHGWGVDDGYGYKSGKTYETSYGMWDETWTFIPYYNAWGVWGEPTKASAEKGEKIMKKCADRIVEFINNFY